MTIHDIPSILASTLHLAATPANIMAGFKVTGIQPLNPLIFSEADFMPSYVTDRPEPTSPSTNRPTNASGSAAEVSETYMPIDPPSISLSRPSTSSHVNYPKPEQLRPFEKAGPRLGTKKGKKKRKSAILTDSPVKEALRQEQLEAKKKKMMARQNKKKKLRKNLLVSMEAEQEDSKGKSMKPKTAKGKKLVHSGKKKIVNDSDDEDENCVCIYCLKPYNQSKKGQDWVQCLRCKRWSHDKCAKGNTLFFVCKNCNSDDEDD